MSGDRAPAPVRYEVNERVAVITLDRPAQRNAFGDGMGAALAAAYRRADADDSVRCVVLTGTPPAFCAGADLTAGDTTFAGTSAGFTAAGIDFPAWQVRKPVIAAVNGHAVGIGLTLALQCDLRIMADDARYGVVQVRRGVIGDAHSHWVLPRLIGIARSAEILLTGATFDGHRALELGIANRCVPRDDVLPTALQLARDIAINTAPLSVAASKELLWASYGLSIADVGRDETRHHIALMDHPDAREGVRAHLESRDPDWSGRLPDRSNTKRETT